MREKEIEAYLVRRVKKLGGVAEKFTSPGRRSVPDRLVTLPGGRVCFVEVKATGGKVTDNQARDHERRRKMGFAVFVVDSKEAVDRISVGQTVFHK
jgi:hypothetical protein